MDTKLIDMKQIGCYIKLGTMLQGVITIVTLGNGYQIAQWIANKLGYESCGCAEREDYLNGLTCKEIRDMKKKIDRLRKQDPYTYKHQ